MTESFLTPAGPLVLIILDGWGLREETEGNAIALAETPVWDKIWQEAPSSRLQASGEAVGLADGQMGNSNVGHLNLGAGRIVEQPLRRIDRLIDTGAFGRLPVIEGLIAQARQGGTLHLAGLCSDGGVHSHLRHLYALLDLAEEARIDQLAVHAFLDGRDVGPQTALSFLEPLAHRLSDQPGWRLASICGRYFAMDRDERWERTMQAYELLVNGSGRRTAPSVKSAVEAAYEAGETDEFVAPTVLAGSAENAAVLRDGDQLLLFNFRADRARQLVRMLTEPQPPAGVQRPQPPEVHLASMMEYDRRFDIPYAVDDVDLSHTFGEVVSAAGLRQLRIAETEKYAHVTYFFNGGREEPFKGEMRRIIPSPQIATYDLQPEMSAAGLTDALLELLPEHDVVIVNYANPDMVGHTGDLEAAIKAVAAVDRCLGRVLARIEELDGAALVLADHGNAEQMVAGDGSPHTAHTLNPVPCTLVHHARPAVRLRDGVLGDAAPTLLELLGIEAPETMTCTSLIIHAAEATASEAD